MTDVVWRPYASSSDAAWADIKLIARFDPKRFSFDEAIHHGEPTGIVRMAETPSAIPYPLLKESPGLDKRVLIIDVGEEPTNSVLVTFAGVLIAFLGMFLVRNPRPPSPSGSAALAPPASDR